MNIYKIDNNISFTIKPWKCKFCESLIVNHPYYCNICYENNDLYSVLPEADILKKINKINKVKNVFNKIDKIILPVLACSNKEQFMKNIKNMYLCYKQNKIDGIFLISTNIDIKDFKNIYKEAKSLYNDFWIGVNIIGESIFKVLDFIKNYNPDGIWVDNSYLNNENNLGICELILNQINKYNWKGLYFGGVMFKYTNNCNVYNSKILQLSNQYIDVLTTSGDATGIEIKDEKLNFISNNIKDISLALASGVNKFNIKNLSSKVNIFIVRTSIIDENNDINNDKLDELFYSLIE